ncbi:DUF1772 domain-containing protein [Spirosoma utsteinense]|uniref:Membrane protein n=1 Tax=Spirosoma utsteinense TaxID=2585773 RepID=A0ABR6WDL1_9BACT|nr:anthrone oxygenase family protein [Spirosoma utsteinense]MBC3784206.1 putative membrane protein [Spirosoma utsteinense]MBC3794007.1 putative membrane protein [Spirosoma utsteinense]
MQILVLTATAMTTALITGLFYAYSCSVNPGLHQLPDWAYLAAMQSINRAILNPTFFLSFIGTLVLLPICTWMHYSQPISVRFWLLLLASVLYAIGVVGVTVAGNVPLNEGLDAVSLGKASPDELKACRLAFEQPWNRLHAIRTITCVVTLLLVVATCLSRGETTESATVGPGRVRLP